MKGLRILGYGLLGLLVSLALLLTAVEIISFNIDHYMGEYRKHDIPSVTGMDMDNLQYVTEEMLAYLRDDRDDFTIYAVIRGEEREIFGAREKHHMEDVQDLFIGGRWIRNISLVGIVLLILLFMKKDRHWRSNLAKTSMYTGMANIDLIILLFLLMYINFKKYFDYFHYIFFDNDLWILDPTKEILIQMLPQDFFYNTAVKIAIIYIGGNIALGITGFLYNRLRGE